MPGVRGQGRVGGRVGRHSPVAQRGGVDVRVEPGRERRVRRLWHGARDHQLEKAANTRRRVRVRCCQRGCPPDPWCYVVVLAPGPGQTPSFQEGQRVARGWVAAGGGDLEAAGCTDRLGPGEVRGCGGKSQDPAGSDGEGERGL